jgi:hypothetical protein
MPCQAVEIQPDAVPLRGWTCGQYIQANSKTVETMCRTLAMQECDFELIDIQTIFATYH